ncbi:NAD/NADP octopine/nopaline dehydrogenase family protein [Pectobacterium polonicum]|uniref:NAD/NADP octopine/nopaline dehydrogenase family protein n=3 Tax=Pectobacterium polonicum TaxID=2485124 RepID=A0AAE9NNS9_9GAMM|nr:NAD/NADP-dependent octopine/nopaline dehydrogenase family protein [Pectobacterium polonicum]UVO07015.1 NAD/NADP octopine/nopaline dehydrogenase family protein [Pectobacterium polonicum]GKW23722.1 opine/octopine dehydrogenase [Pectobacterium carotovorum subsp. carotovorum]
MKVAILGAGNIGFASAAWLASTGHTPILWSPHAENLAPLRARQHRLSFTGIIQGECKLESENDIAVAVRHAEVVLLCVPGYGHRSVIDALVPHIKNGQPIIINSACSLSALYLSRQLAERRVSAPIITWGTTVLTARRQVNGYEVAIMAARKFVHVATLPMQENERAIALCSALFGHRFRAQTNVLATSLININPIAHLGLALCNVTRIERHESWPQYHYLTPGVANLITSLEKERQTLAQRFGLTIHSIEAHFQQSFDLPESELADIAEELHRRRGGPAGPTTLDTRFILEDTPYGLVFAEAMAKKVGLALPQHTSVINVVAAIWGRDFRRDNTILPMLELEKMPLRDLQHCLSVGYHSNDMKATTS